MPLTDMQQAYLLNCTHRWNIKTGATGSGKSFVDFAATIPKRLEAMRGEGLAMLLGNTRGTLNRNILEPMREIWPGLVSEIHADNTVDIFGHKCYALGADNIKHVNRLRGATIEYCYGDEITTWSRDVFDMLKSRLRCRHSHFDGTCNPDRPQHWFHKFLFETNADKFVQEYTLYDNPFLPPDVLHAMELDSGIRLSALKVDGGASMNNFLMQFQADIMNAPVHRPECVETTAMGAAYLAGLAVGFWQDKDDVKRYWSLDREFLPDMDDGKRKEELDGWNKAIRATMGWAK